MAPLHERRPDPVTAAPKGAALRRGGGRRGGRRGAVVPAVGGVRAAHCGLLSSRHPLLGRESGVRATELRGHVDRNQLDGRRRLGHGGHDVLLGCGCRRGHVVCRRVATRSRAPGARGSAPRVQVDATVSAQFVLSVEPAATDLAGVGPLSRVYHLMASQVILLRKRPAANITMKWLVSCVSPHVV